MNDVEQKRREDPRIPEVLVPELPHYDAHVLRQKVAVLQQFRLSERQLVGIHAVYQVKQGSDVPGFGQMIVIEGRHRRLQQFPHLLKPPESAHCSDGSQGIEHFGLLVRVLIVPLLPVHSPVFGGFAFETGFGLFRIRMTLDAQASRYGKDLEEERESVSSCSAETGMRIDEVAQGLPRLFNDCAALSVGAHPEFGTGTVLSEVQQICDEIVVTPRVILYDRSDSEDVTHISNSTPVVWA